MRVFCVCTKTKRSRTLDFDYPSEMLRYIIEHHYGCLTATVNLSGGIAPANMIQSPEEPAQQATGQIVYNATTQCTISKG